MGLERIVPYYFGLLGLWAAITLCVPAFALIVSISPELEYVLGLGASYTSIKFSSNSLSVAGIAEFAVLQLPRVGLILAILFFTRSKEVKSQIVSPFFLLLWMPALLIDTYYITASLALLTGMYIGSLRSDGFLRAASVLCCAFVFVYFLFFIEVPRGLMLISLVPLMLSVTRAPLLYKLLLLSAILIVAGFMTLLKFDTTEGLWLLNILYRIGSYGQLVAYTNSSAALFDPGMTLFEDWILSLPLVRSSGGSIDEQLVFSLMTEGGAGGFAVSPELRALSYHQNLFFALVDLIFTYTSIFCILYLMAKVSSIFRIGIILTVPIFIQMDNVFSITYAFQIIVVVSLVEYLHRLLRRRRFLRLQIH